MMKRIGLMLATLCVSAAAASAQTSMIEPGEIGRVEAHGVCRMVDNQNSARMMVPHSMVTEWASGGSAFLARSPVNTNISLCPCTWANVDHQLIPVLGKNPSHYYSSPKPFNKGESAFFGTLANSSNADIKVAHLSNGVIDFASQPLLFPQERDRTILEVSSDGEYIATLRRGSFYMHNDLTTLVQRRTGSGYSTVHTLHQNNSNQMSTILNVSPDFSTIVHFPGRWGDVRVYERQSNGSYTRVADISTGFINQNNFRNLRAYVDEDNGKIFIHQYWTSVSGTSSQTFNEMFTLQRTGNTYQHVDTHSLDFDDLHTGIGLLSVMPRFISNDGSKVAGFLAQHIYGDPAILAKSIDGSRTSAPIQTLTFTPAFGWAPTSIINWISDDEFAVVFTPNQEANRNILRASNPNHASLPSGYDTLGWAEFYRVTDTPSEFSLERVKIVYLEGIASPLSMSIAADISPDGSSIGITIGANGNMFNNWVLKTHSDC